MVEYSEGYEHGYVDGYKFTKDKHTGYFLSSKKIGDRRKRLHVYVWEKVNKKPVPKGYHVHHIDGNKNNNEIDNLTLMQGKMHFGHHNRNMTDEHKAKLTKKLVEKAVPLSKEWHKSAEGHNWHVEHGKKVFQNQPLQKYKCTFCGKVFESRKHYDSNSNTFCSNNCKSAYRRKSGVDDIIKICEKCGGEYVENKYRKNKLCPSCRRRTR